MYMFRLVLLCWASNLLVTRAQDDCVVESTVVSSMLQVRGHDGERISEEVLDDTSSDPIIMVSKHGDADVTVTCPAGYWVTSGGCNALEDGHDFYHSYPVGETEWRCTTKSGDIKATAFCTNMFKTRMVESREYDWAYAWCPTGYRVMGGGCSTNRGGHWQEATPVTPSDGTQGYLCGGHGSWKNVVAICTDSSQPMKIHGGGIGGDWETPKCDDSGWVTVGGGCKATNGVHYFQASEPATNGWLCGGHGTAKQVKAVCMKLPETTTTTTTTPCTSCNLKFRYVKLPLPSSTSFETYSDYIVTVPNTCTPTEHIKSYGFPHIPLNLLMKFKSPYSGKTARNVVSGD